MRIGIFGGSFNPPHLMHKNIALELIKNNYLDKVIYVPTGNSYNKANLVSEKNRYEMLKLMIDNNKYLEVSDYEFGELHYTYQTLDYFKDKYSSDEIYFICGTDNLKQLNTWKNYLYILNNYKLIVIKRDNDNVLYILNNYDKEGKKILTLDIVSDTISSTKIRNFIKEKRDVSNLVDAKVYKYILDNDLYR